MSVFTIELPCTDVMIGNGITHGPPAPGDFGEPLGGWPVGSVELDSGYLSTGRTALSTPYVGPAWAVYDEVGFVFYDAHDSTLINMGVESAPTTEEPDLFYWREDRVYDVEFQVADIDDTLYDYEAATVELVAHLSVTGGGFQRFWLTYEDDFAPGVRWDSFAPAIEPGGAGEQIREFTMPLPGMVGDSRIGRGVAARFAQTGGGATCRVTYLALRVTAPALAKVRVLRQYPRDDAYGFGGVARNYPPARRGRNYGQQP